MSSKHVVLELLPGRIDVVVFDGSKRVDAQRLPLDAVDDVAEWVKAVRKTAGSLRALVDRMGVSGRKVRVLYRSPTQLVEVSSVSVKGTGNAVEAARMSCFDSLTYSAMSAVCASRLIGRDAAGGDGKTHVIAAAEREDVADSIAQLVHAAGLTYESATPRDAAVIAGVVRRELKAKTPRSATLYVGEHVSYFAVSDRGTILFQRRIDLGLSAMINSLTRPMKVPGRAEAVELSVDDAHAILRTHGVPDRDALVHEGLELTGAQIMPLLSPMLQRCVVELRQSIRFGLQEADRAALTLMLSGPGASIHGLADVLGRELSLEVGADPSYLHAGDWFDAGPTCGEMADARADTKLLDKLDLMASGLAEDRHHGRMRRWIITGTAAAVAMLAIDGFRLQKQIDAIQVEADTYAAQKRDLDALQNTDEQLTAVIGAASTLEQRIAEHVGNVLDYRACLLELTRVTPPSVRLTSASFTNLNEGPMGSVVGLAFHRDGVGTTALEDFIVTLEGSPLFQDIVLGNVQIGRSGDRKGEQFAASFQLVAVPPAVLDAARTPLALDADAVEIGAADTDTDAVVVAPDGEGETP